MPRQTVCEKCGEGGGTLTRVGGRREGRYHHVRPCRPEAVARKTGILLPGTPGAGGVSRLWVPKRRET